MPKPKIFIISPNIKELLAYKLRLYNPDVVDFVKDIDEADLIISSSIKKLDEIVKLYGSKKNI